MVVSMHSVFFVEVSDMFLRKRLFALWGSLCDLFGFWPYYAA